MPTGKWSRPARGELVRERLLGAWSARAGLAVARAGAQDRLVVGIAGAHARDHLDLGGRRHVFVPRDIAGRDDAEGVGPGDDLRGDSGLLLVRLTLVPRFVGVHGLLFFPFL